MTTLLSQYTPGRARFYCDVDGVIFPFDTEITTASVTLHYEDGGKIDEFHFNQEVADWLAQISSKTDFVWLTSWRENAPTLLDPVLGTKSLGYLPWAAKLSDHTQFFKKVALKQDQQLSSSPFVWVDDVANRTYSGEPLFLSRTQPKPKWDKTQGAWLEPEYVTDIPEEQYLSVTTDSWAGLTTTEMEQITRWVENHSLQE